MKLIEAMKAVKANKVKIADLQAKIAANSAHTSFETPLYGNNQQTQIGEWLRSAFDTARDNVKLLTRISKTNLQTPVTIDLGDRPVTKSIAEWVWRRREYASIDLATARSLSDRNLKEGHINSTIPGGPPVTVTIVRYYEPTERDRLVAMYASEAAAIDAALEVANAITDLAE